MCIVQVNHDTGLVHTQAVRPRQPPVLAAPFCFCCPIRFPVRVLHNPQDPSGLFLRLPIDVPMALSAVLDAVLDIPHPIYLHFTTIAITPNLPIVVKGFPSWSLILSSSSCHSTPSNRNLLRRYLFSILFILDRLFVDEASQLRIRVISITLSAFGALRVHAHHSVRPTFFQRHTSFDCAPLRTDAPNSR